MYSEDIKEDNLWLMKGDCLERMKGIADGSIDLTVTSPPYDNLRTYNSTLDWGEHVWKPVLQELFRVTKDGGVVVWIVNDATIKGSETGTSFRQALYAKEKGFKFDCVTLVFSCYSDSVKALDYWLTTDSVGQLYEYLDSKAIGYVFA